MNLIRGMAEEVMGNVKRELCHRRVQPTCALAFLTYRCTNCCKTCNLWQLGKDGRDEMDRAGWMTAVKNLERLGVRSLEIFGGDALLRKDVLFDLIRECRIKGITTFLPTNANLCDSETLKSLIDSGLDMLYFSVDDLDEAHDLVRGVSGNFAKIAVAIEEFFRLRGDKTVPRLGIVTTLSRMNFRNFPRLVEFLESYPISAIYPRPLAEFSPENVAGSLLDGSRPEPFFMPTDGESHLITPGELAEFKEMVRRAQSRTSRVYVCWKTYYSTSDATHLKGEYPHASCRVATTLMTIAPNGDVSPCPFYRCYHLGNIAFGEATGIWGTAKHRRFIAAQQSAKLPICLNCNLRPYHDSSLLETARFYAVRGAEKAGLYCRF
ncbi:radical SAM protein [Geomonas sp. RF6]|uniref:radical SAM protein n=1 Tax=Geomonas sp. RF6 TaxID=2897342 RepID=UPI001E394BEB|nr:radical SAM protein [Geomonas sp. RF6]UFS69134.1 radical SAM protein [Geomonas sp. RF6]